MHEPDLKVERLAALARSLDLSGILLAAQPNFAWLTAGQSNRIDGSREAGAGALLVAADGRRFVVASAIEMPRLLGEALAGLDFEPVELPWAEEKADPGATVRRARQALAVSGQPGGTAGIGSDLGLPDTVAVDTAVTRVRVPLTPSEVAARAYADLGVPGEEQKHHQGGAIGYRSRDWVAHPASGEVVQPWQAFAWNPSITGSKVEDTVLVTDQGFENVTADASWPTVEVTTGAGTVRAAGVLNK